MKLFTVVKSTNLKIDKAKLFDMLMSNKTIREKENPKFYTYQVDWPRSTVMLSKYTELRGLCEALAPEKVYKSFSIPKASGGMRQIDAPAEELVEFQRTIERNLKYFKAFTADDVTEVEVKPHNAAYAYVKNRDTTRALEQHQKNKSKWFLKMDIKNFFPSFTLETINELRQYVYPWCYIPQQDWDTMMNLLTLNGKLPQGSPASPYVTNILFKYYDYQISQMLTEFFKDKDKYVYTRYADDLLISMKKKLSDVELQELKQNVTNCISKHFTIKEEKTRYGSSHGSNWNLGLMLNKDNKITLGYKQKRVINAMVNNLFKAVAQQAVPRESEVLLNKDNILGNVSYLKKVEPGYAQYMIEKYERKYNLRFKDVRTY